jgi:membrane protease YdiL (CAAX protease family)
MYLVLGLLTLFLYWRLISSGPSEPMEPQKARAVQTLERHEWWPGAHEAQKLQAALEQAPGLAVALGVMAAVGISMGLGGFILLVWGLWTGRVRTVWRSGTRRPPPWSYGELARITVLGVLMAALMPFVRLAMLALRPGWSIDLNLWIAVSMLLLDGFVVLAVLAFAAGKARSIRQLFGFTWQKFRGAVTTGLRGYVAVFPWLFVLLVMAVAVARQLGVSPPVEPLQELIFEEQRPLVLGLTIVLACLVGPVTEEFFFRGVLYGAIRRHTPRGVAMALSGAIFALVHTNLIGFLPILVLGCLLADLYERTGSLVSPLVVHIAHNTFLMTVSLVFRQLPTIG